MQVLSTKFGGRPVALAIALASLLLGAGCANNSSSTASSVTATPTFNPGAGSYNTSQTVTISDGTPGAILYCTTDGTTPTTASPQCSEPTTVYRTEFLQAIAVAPGMNASPIAAAAYSINLNSAATPTFSPAGSTYTSTQNVTIADATSGANIYYTTDGTVPTANSALYTGPIHVTTSQVLTAFATASGFNNSTVASSAYTINPAVTATPTFTPAAGTYTTTQTVQLSDVTPGAVIYYTTNGTTASPSATPYTGPITVSSSETVSAIAVAAGTNSPVSQATYTITPPAATPAFSVAAGTYTSVQTVSITDATSGSTIFYTTDGTTPTTSSMQYTTPLMVSKTQTIQAIATASGFTNSAIGSAIYTINLPGTAAPVITPASGTYNAAQTVSISDTTAGALIYYTVNGDTPTALSTPYTAPFQVSSSETVNAIAIAAGGSSPVTSNAYTIQLGTSSFGGTVLSGTKAISGASVQLYAAGTSGYAAGASTLGGPVTTASDGTFTVHYNCPAAPGDQVYLVSTGGAGASSNSGAVLMAALGSCSTLTASTNVTVNEVTTVAGAYALAQFATPNTSASGIIVGTSTGNTIGLSNSMKTPHNLVDATGAALSITPSYKALGGTSGGVLNSSYVPQARINTLADILAACVESTSGASACTSLYTAATPAGGSAPSDTLQAILSIAQHPGTNTSALYALYAASQPFKPALTSTPHDWTLALTFTGGGLGPIPGNEPGFSTGIGNMALDAQGNIWLYTNSMCLDPNTFNSFAGLVEFDNQGNPLSPASTASNNYCGGFQPQFNGAPVLNGAGLAVDLNGFLWAGAGSNQVAKISSDGTVKQANYTSPLSGAFCSPSSMAVDASNEVWVGCLVASNGNGGVGAMNASDGSVIGGNYGGYSYQAVSSIALDLSGNVWGVPAQFSGTLIFSNLYQFNAIDGQFDLISDHSSTGGTFMSPVVVDGVGNVFSVPTRPGTINELQPDGKTLKSLNYPFVTGSTGIEHFAIDGAGNLWGSVFTGVAFGAATVPSYLVELTPDGTVLSPTGTNIYGYSGSGGGGETQPIVSDVNPSSGATADIAIDSSGNLWVANGNIPGTYIPDSPPIGEQLVEFIGIAPPVATPMAQTLVLNKVGARP